MPCRSAGAKTIKGHGKLFGFIAQRPVRPSIPARIAIPSPFPISTDFACI